MDTKNPANGQDPLLENQERAAPIRGNEVWKESERTTNRGMALNMTLDRISSGRRRANHFACVEGREGKGKGRVTLTACKACKALAQITKGPAEPHAWKPTKVELCS
jgi:hypothetical protein